MASMLAKACTGPSKHMQVKTFQQKKSRNKRKLRVDPPSADHKNAIPSSSNELTGFKFSAERYDSHEYNVNRCDVCDACQVISDALELNLGLSCNVETSELEDIDILEEELYDTDWSGIAEFQLEELVLSSLDAIFRSAIKKIVAMDYSEELASKAILRAGLWYGREDMVTNIVENTLALLRNGYNVDTSKGYYFGDLQEMKKFVLAELICLLREVRPFLSNGDIMWCLLMSDMNLSHACVTDSYRSQRFLDVSTSDSCSSISEQYQLKNELKDSETNTLAQCKPVRLGSDCGGQKMQSDELPSLSAEASFDPSESVVSYENQNFVSKTIEKPVCESKSTAGELSSSGALIKDNKLKCAADSMGVCEKGSVKATKGFNVPPSNKVHTVATINRFLSTRTINPDTIDDDTSFPKSNMSSILPKIWMSDPFAPPFADSELSLSIHEKTKDDPVPMSYNIEASPLTFPGSSNDESIEQWFPPNTKDQRITNLNSRVKQLQNLLQEWSEWANQKVMQAARRLSKDKDELKALKQERGDVERLKKQRQKFQEGALRKLSEMENALRKTSGQIERGNASVRRLEAVNASLRRQMEAAKSDAIESSAYCKEVLEREKKFVMQVQSAEKLKRALQDELLGEKAKVVQLNQKLRQAKDCKDQIEARLNQEETAKNKLLSQVNSFRQEREQMEASVQSKEDMIKSKAETNLQQYKDDIKKLEKEISQLRLKTDSSKIAALKRCEIDRFKDASAKKDSSVYHVSKMATSQHLRDCDRTKVVKRERECVMCLTEEISVVFLPCAHQVVCSNCNDLHQKQGMKDCPSCRAPIQRRVCVRFARSLV